MEPSRRVLRFERDGGKKVGSVTRKHIWNQVRRDIRRSNDTALDLAKRLGQSFVDVRDTMEFKVALANHIRKTGCHLHLPEFTPDNVRSLE
jgi:hypothetical protein